VRYQSSMTITGTMPDCGRVWTCVEHACMLSDMSKMVQVRDVPDRVHRTLKARAAREGMSLSDLIKRELERTAERPSMLEWLERAQQTKTIATKRPAVQIVRELRDVR
jgi:antitoxin FitA